MIDTTTTWVIFGMTIVSYLVSFIPIVFSGLTGQLTSGSSGDAATDQAVDAFTGIIVLFSSIVTVAPLAWWASVIRLVVALVNWWQLGWSLGGLGLLCADMFIWGLLNIILFMINIAGLLPGFALHVPWNYIISGLMLIGFASLGSFLGWSVLNVWLT